jgi:hypothetical protein
MKFSTTIRTSLLVLISALTINNSLLAQSRYRVTSLGTIGGDSSAGNSINNISWVTGTSTINSSNSVIHAALWAYGFKFDLGTLGGPNSAVLWPDKNTYGVISELRGFLPAVSRSPCLPWLRLAQRIHGGTAYPRWSEWIRGR